MAYGEERQVEGLKVPQEYVAPSQVESAVLVAL